MQVDSRHCVVVHDGLRARIEALEEAVEGIAGVVGKVVAKITGECDRGWREGGLQRSTCHRGGFHMPMGWVVIRGDSREGVKKAECDAQREEEAST